MHLTEHSIERAKERLSLRRLSLQRLAERAFKSGKKRKECGGKLLKYLKRFDKEVRIYGDVIFVFTTYKKEPSLVTVWQLPPEFRKYLKAA